MKLPNVLLLLLEQSETASIFYEGLKLIVVGVVTTILTYFLTRRKNEAEALKIRADTTETETNRVIAEQKNKAYWMDKFEEGLEAGIKMEEQNADLRIFKKHAMRLFRKVRRAIADYEEEEFITVKDELDEIILEGDF